MSKRVINNLTRVNAIKKSLQDPIMPKQNKMIKYGLTPEQMLEANKNHNRGSEQVLANRKRNIKKRLRKNTPTRVSPKQRTHIENYRDRTKINPSPSLLQSPGWFTSQGHVDVSIIVPLYNSYEDVKLQIDSWDLGDDGLVKEVIYVDDKCPKYSYKSVLKAWDDRKNKIKASIGKIVINANNSGFGAACNVGASYANGKYFIFLNADTIVSPNWIKPMINPLIKDQSIGIVGNLHVSANGNVDSAGSQWNWGTKTFQHIGRHILNGSQIQHAYKLDKAPPELLRPSEREMVTGACFAIRRDLFIDLGGFDEEFRIGYWEDSDLNLRVRDAGYSILYEPASRIIHRVGHSKAGGHEFMGENRRRFMLRWVDTGRIDKFVKMERPGGDPKKTIKHTVKDKVYGCVIACNEEEFLEASVESASPLIDEWLFVIGGNEYAHKAGMCNEKGYPNDATFDIAKSLAVKYGGKVIEPPNRLWRDKVEMRNAYVSHLRQNDWMFMVDGDEVYKMDQLWRITELMQHHEVLILNFWLFWNNINTIGTGTWNNYPQERVVKWKDGYKYRGRNHLWVSNDKKELIHKVRPCWMGKDKMFYHYSWVRPIEKIKQKREYYKYQSRNINDTYLENVFLKWRENPDAVMATHPMGGGGAAPFEGIHPEIIQKLVKQDKLNFG